MTLEEAKLTRRKAVNKHVFAGLFTIGVIACVIIKAIDTA